MRSASRVVILPEPFIAIGLHYTDFGQVDDGAVLEILREHRR